MTSELKIAIPDTATDEITAMFINSARTALTELLKQPAPKAYLNQKEASAYLGISVATLKKLNIPKVSLEGIERYSRISLDQYCKDNEI